MGKDKMYYCRICGREWRDLDLTITCCNDQLERTKDKSVLKEAVDLFGENSQVMMAIEECAEMVLAICHLHRKKCTVSDLCSEIADVEIMMSQLRYIFDSEEVDSQKIFKINRLKDLIEEFKKKEKKNV